MHNQLILLLLWNAFLTAMLLSEIIIFCKSNKLKKSFDVSLFVSQKKIFLISTTYPVTLPMELEMKKNIKKIGAQPFVVRDIL